MISSSHLVRRGLPAFLVLIAALYCFPFVRPLHLESDSVCYLHAAELMAEGQGAGCPGCDRTHCSIQYPPGYPWVVSLLIRAGVATPATLVLLNVVGLLVALAAATGVWRRAYGLDSTVRLGLMALVGLCLPVYRYVVNPLSDFLFLGLALPSLFLMTMAASTSGWRRCSSLVLAAALAFGAFEVRTIGIALVPSFLWAALAQSRQVTSLWARIGRYRARTALLVAGLALVGVGIAVIASRSEYVTVDLRTQYARSAGATFIRVLGYHFTELGELAVNVPVGKLPPQIRPALQVIGVPVFGLLVGALWRRRHDIGPADVFLASTSAIIFVWPFGDPRFWLPVLPVALGLAAWAMTPVLNRRALRPLLGGIVAIFIVFGLAGQAYSARLSLAGDDFPNRFADDYLGPVYRVAWGLHRPNDTQPIDRTALHVLQRFEPRARPHAVPMPAAR